MRSHDHDHDQAEDHLRPHGTRLDEGRDAQVLTAAAQGRTDVLDAGAFATLQRSVGNGATAAMAEREESPVLDVVGSGGGSPLDAGVRENMESRLGHDFSDVRVHTNTKASDSAKSVNAQAYTVGSDVVFQQDKYDPGSHDGQVMLAHELTHVVQQRQGPVDGTETGDGVKVSNPSDRFEQDASSTAERAMSAPPAPSVSTFTGPAVQRAEAGGEEHEEEEAVQGSFVQRAEAPEEEVEE